MKSINITVSSGSKPRACVKVAKEKPGKAILLHVDLPVVHEIAEQSHIRGAKQESN